MTLGVVGDIVQDVVVYPLASFAPGSDTPSRIERRRGGSAANVAAAASALTATRFIGCVGDDRTGRELADSLPGVDVRLQITQARTGTIAILVGADGERHMFPDRGANACLTTIDPSWLDGLVVLHATAYSLAGGTTAGAVRQAIRQANAKGVITSLDASSVALIRHTGIQTFIDLVGDLEPAIVFANAAEAAVLGWDAPQPTTSPAILPQSGSHPPVVFVKDGARPALVRAASGAWFVPTTKLPVVDTTGAGDAFAAGVLAHVVNAGMTRDDIRQISEPKAKQLATAGHECAAAWLGNR